VVVVGVAVGVAVGVVVGVAVGVVIYSRIDVQFSRHPRALRAGREARDLWYWAHAYVTEQLTDGVVPREALALYPYDDRFTCAARLVQVGLWEEHPDGWLICRFAAKGGQLKEHVEERRSGDRDRKALSRSSETKIKCSEPVRADSKRTASSSSSYDPDPERRSPVKRQLSLPVPIGGPRLLPRPPEWAAPPQVAVRAATELLEALEPPRRAVGSETVPDG